MFYCLRTHLSFEVILVLLIQITIFLIRQKLKLLQLNSAGTDAYIKPGVLAPQTVLANATGAYGKAVAEHLFAMGLAIQKKLHLYRDDQNACVWGDEGTVSSISDATVLVVGLGDIGTHFARMRGVLSRLAGATPSGA